MGLKLDGALFVRSGSGLYLYVLCPFLSTRVADVDERVLFFATDFIAESGLRCLVCLSGRCRVKRTRLDWKKHLQELWILFDDTYLRQPFLWLSERFRSRQRCPVQVVSMTTKSSGYWVWVIPRIELHYSSVTSLLTDWRFCETGCTWASFCPYVTALISINAVTGMVCRLSLPGAGMISLSVCADESVSKRAVTQIWFLLKKSSRNSGRQGHRWKS